MLIHPLIAQLPMPILLSVIYALLILIGGMILTALLALFLTLLAQTATIMEHVTPVQLESSILIKSHVSLNPLIVLQSTQLTSLFVMNVHMTLIGGMSMYVILAPRLTYNALTVSIMERVQRAQGL